MSTHAAHVVAAALIGFIAGVAVASVIGWFLRDKIKAAMIKRRQH